MSTAAVTAGRKITSKTFLETPQAPIRSGHCHEWQNRNHSIIVSPFHKGSMVARAYWKSSLDTGRQTCIINNTEDWEVNAWGGRIVECWRFWVGGYVCCCWIFFPLSMLVFEILSWLCYLKSILNHPVQCLREVGFDDLQGQSPGLETFIFAVLESARSR